MYLYFDKNGVLREIVNDEALRQGSANVNSIYAYFENEAIAGAWINIEFSNETTTMAIMTYDGLSEIPDNKNRDLKYFKDYQEYPFYKYTLDTDELAISGQTKATIYGTDEVVSEPIVLPTNVYAQGLIVFNIEESAVQESVDIDQSQWNYLLAQIAVAISDIGQIQIDLPLKEDKSNKKNTLTNSNTDYPTTHAVKEVTDELGRRTSSLESGLDELYANYVVSATQTGNTLHLVTKVNGATVDVYFQSSDENAVWGNITGTLSNQTDLQDALDDKVDKISGYSLMSNDEHTKLSGIESGAQVNVLEGVQKNGVDLSISNKKVNVTVPTKTSELQNDSDFATEDFVNSSVATNTAYYLGSYNLVSDLGFTVPTSHSDVADALPEYLSGLTPPITPTNNDYLFVQVPTATATPTVIDHIDRYKYNAQYQEWIYEYTLNNSSFTQAQWDAINSGITSGDVSAFESHIQNTSIHVTTSDKEVWSAKQNAINSNNMLSSDVVTDTGNSHKFVTAEMYNWLVNQTFQAPVIGSFTIKDTNAVAIPTTNETGSSYSAASFAYTLSNTGNVDGKLTLKQGTTTINNNVAVSASTQVTISPTISISSNTTFTLSGVNTLGNSFSKSYTVNFIDYVYYIVTSNTTTPTSGLTKSVQASTTTTGFNVSYVAGDYIYFYHTSSGKKVQQYALGQWNDVTSTSLGSVTITKANGTTGTYYCYRVGPFVASGTDQFRIA